MFRTNIIGFFLPKQTHNDSNINPSYPPLMSFIKDQLGYILKNKQETKKNPTKNKIKIGVSKITNNRK